MSLRRRLQLSTRGDAGMATAELAIALVALSVVAQFLLAGGAIVAAQLQASDAARISARLAARGESMSTVARAASQVAPHSQVSVSTVAGTVVAQVRVVPPMALARRLVPAIKATARSVDESATSTAGER